MIHFEILHSPDRDVLGNFKFHQNTIYLGLKEGNLLIRDNSILNSHLMMEVIENELLIHPQRDVSHYLIDGKRSTTIRKVKRGQKITIGNTTFKIIEFTMTSFPSKKEILEKKMDEITKSSSPKIQVIELLAQMMK